MAEMLIKSFVGWYQKLMVVGFLEKRGASFDPFGEKE